MIKLLHCADLHLSAARDERGYCLSVLDEIVAAAVREGAGYLLFAGDTFNSFGDAEALRDEFRSRIEPLRGRCEPVLVSGNHEDLGRNGRRLASFDLGIEPECVVESSGGPFTLLRRDGVEFLALPHRADYRDYTGWNVPEKKEPFRVAAAHGIVAGMSYTWEDEETDARAAVMDADLFQRYLVDYAALGHIHSFRRVRAGGTELLYPGSARVWRKNEMGPRRAALVTLDEAIHLSPLELKAAGQYRPLDVFVSFDGTPAELPSEAEDWGPADYAYLKFSGLVENEREALDSVRKLISEMEERVRRVAHETELSVLEGVSGHPVAKKFLQLLEERKPVKDGEEYPVWKRAREMGLLKIKETVEAGS